MATYTVSIPPQVRKSIHKVPLPWQNRIIKTLTLLQAEPYLGQKMRGKFAGFYRIKVWPYRIIYTIDHGKLFIEVVEVDHRGHVSYR